MINDYIFIVKFILISIKCADDKKLIKKLFLKDQKIY